MDYQQVMDYLASLARFGVKPGLERTEALLEALGRPERRMLHVHIAGTNGKGSTAIMIERVLREAGYRTGLYTSPHLQRYTERIKVCGCEISQSRFAELISGLDRWVRKAAADPDVGAPTEFEVATAACFQHFADEGVEIAVVEVGLGGRYDSTNLIVPEVSVIAHIAMDHMDRLGHTLAEIAHDKAGIIKPGVPVVTAPQEPEAMEVLKAVAKKQGAPLVAVGHDVPFECTGVSLDGTSVRVDLSRLRRGRVLHLTCGLVGEHQAVNCATAIAALDMLERRFPISEDQIIQGLNAARHPGRFEVVQRKPYVVVLDGAHNPDGARALAATLNAAMADARPRVMVLGCSKDKQLGEIADALAPAADAVVAASAAHTRSGAADAHEIAAMMRARGVQAEAVAGGDAEAALQRAEQIAHAIGARSLVVAGSLYLVGELRGRLVAD